MDTINNLANTIVSGTATEEAKGLALRTVQLALGAQFLETLNAVTLGTNKLASLLDRVTDKFEEQVNARLDSDTLELADLAELIKDIQNRQLQVAELQRKVVQSNTKIFPEDSISPEERKLLVLFSSFTTQQDKQAFLQAVQKAMEPDPSNDFDA